MTKILQDGLNNTYRSLLRGMGVWDKRFFKDYFPGLLQNKGSKLNIMTLMADKTKKEICMRNSNFLGKESFAGLPEKVEKRCLALVGELREDSYICIDEVDISKKRAKQMEGLSKIRDSSEKRIVNGYIFHGASTDGIPLMIRQEDLVNKTKSDYFGKLVLDLKKATKGKGIYVFDALYDAKSYMQFLQEEELNFIIRAKRERVLYRKDGSILGKMKQMPEGVHEIYFKQDTHKKRGEKILTQAYLYVKQFPGYKDPLRIYSNTPDRDILEYRERWDIECIFKAMKQEYKMEEIQASSLQVIVNIVATIQMAVAFSHHLYGIQHEHKGKTFFQCNLVLKNRFKKYIKWQSLTMNRNAYIKFIGYVIERMYRGRKKKKKRYITSQTEISSQLRLFRLDTLEKT